MRALFLLLSLWALTARAELVLQQERADCKTYTNLVMVHGFSGSAHTWDEWLALLRGDASLPCLRLYTFSYETGWKDSLPDIPGIAKELRSALLQLPPGPLFLMAHSMGGLVVKEMLLQDSEDPKILPNLKHVFFFATPHRGVRRPVPLLAGHKSSQVKELRRPNVRDQRHQWEEKATSKEDGQVEIKSASGVYSFYGTAIIGAHDRLVPHYSASGGFSDVLRVDAGHTSVKEPASTQDKTYQKVWSALQTEQKQILN